MPGGRRGGARQGTPGTAYPERTDLNQSIRTAPGQPYGVAGQQAAAMRAVPLPAAQPPPPIVGPHEPSQMPGQHVMTGVPQGPGAGPEAVTPPPVNMAPQASNGDVLSQLQALLAVSSRQPAGANPGLINLIDSIKSGDYTRGGVYGKALGQP